MNRLGGWRDGDVGDLMVGNSWLRLSISCCDTGDRSKHPLPFVGMSSTTKVWTAQLGNIIEQTVVPIASGNCIERS